MQSLFRSTARAATRAFTCTGLRTQKSSNIVWSEAGVDFDTRSSLLKQKGATLWMTGLSGSGKSTVAIALEEALLRRGIHAYRLDGDNVRFGLNSNLGFSAEDRSENIRRIGEVAKLFNESCCICITSFISPYAADRDAVRAHHLKDGRPFFEIYVKVPVSVAEARDPKGLYKKARAGEIKQFTGISDPYDEPVNAELVISTDEIEVSKAVDIMIGMLEKDGLIPK
eukprot:NODE_5747_length_913_cov_84.317722_g5522_i0.p1 GENE.NODE_5747_length_913_cov_84.317722_g5522_i0~~NODE_5747_length_913_cov_84.317722_g5522_i0.p1  ORF type:complete len:251 (-),score=55.28 NODE_5747_length_913_cov_84.317722_g5522_i0:161-838(-)